MMQESARLTVSRRDAKAQRPSVNKSAVQTILAHVDETNQGIQGHAVPSSASLCLGAFAGNFRDRLLTTAAKLIDFALKLFDAFLLDNERRNNHLFIRWNHALVAA